MQMLCYWRLTTRFVTRVTRRVSKVEHEVFTLLQQVRTPPFLVVFILFMYNNISSFCRSVLCLKGCSYCFAITTGVTSGAGTTYPSVASESPLIFIWVRVAQIFIICGIQSSIIIVVIFLPIFCMSFFELRILITPLISSNFQLTIAGFFDSYICMH